MCHFINIQKQVAQRSCRAFAGILEKDRTLYGTLRSDTLINSDSDVWQQAVDLVIDGNNLRAEEAAVTTAVGGGEIDDNDV